MDWQARTDARGGSGPRISRAIFQRGVACHPATQEDRSIARELPGLVTLTKIGQNSHPSGPESTTQSPKPPNSGPASIEGVVGTDRIDRFRRSKTTPGSSQPPPEWAMGCLEIGKRIGGPIRAAEAHSMCPFRSTRPATMDAPPFHSPNRSSFGAAVVFDRSFGQGRSRPRPRVVGP